MPSKDKRAYFKLDVGYLTNPKVAAASLESPTAILLHVGAMGYAAQHLTDGVVPGALLVRLTGAAHDDLDVLERHNLAHPAGHGCTECPPCQSGEYVVHDYLQHQRSAADVKGASELGQRAASARWGADRSPERTALGNANRMPDAERGASAVAMPREEREEREKKASPSSKRARETTIPHDWQPTDEHRSFAQERGLDVEWEAEQFRAHAEANDRRVVRWNAAFRQWLLKARPRPRASSDERVPTYWRQQRIPGGAA